MLTLGSSERPLHVPAWGRIGNWLIALVLLCGIALDTWVADHHYPLEHWLVFSYLRVWFFALVFCASSLSAGWRLLAILLPRWSRLSERLLMAFALGVLVFYGGMFLGGLLKLYGTAFFFLWPLLLLIGSTLGTRVDILEIRSNFRRVGARLWHRRGTLETLALVLSALLVIAVYLQAMLPANVCFDARWYHLPIAEHYVAAGGIVRFDEGSYLGAYPQMASLFYAWSLLAPGQLFDHILLCAHLEFCLFLFTLLGIGVLAERILGGGRLHFSAAILLAFPGIVVYDSNLNCGADHILAFWAAPIMLSLLRLHSHFSVREGVYSGLVTAGALCTKYQGCLLFVGAATLLLVMTLARRKPRPLLAWAFAVGVVTASHWLKNGIYYHDPLYPLLAAHLPSTPFHAGADVLLKKIYWLESAAPRGTTIWEKLGNALRACATFSFVLDPNVVFPGETRPAFGTLFTLLTPALLLLRPPRRIWIVFAAVYLGIVTWYLTSHQIRFMQTLLPCMAAASVAVLALIYRRGGVARAAAGLLVITQLGINSDFYFTPHHWMLGGSPLVALTEYLGAAHKHEYASRYHFADQEEAVGTRLPSTAKVLVHHIMMKVGIGRQNVTDMPGWQGAIEYLQLSTPRAVRRIWNQIGVTHVVWRPDNDRSTDPEEVARELVFLRSIEQYVNAPEDIGGFRVASLGTKTKEERLEGQPTRIAWLGCNDGVAAGVYAPAAIGVRRFERPLDADAIVRSPSQQLADVNAIAVGAECTEMKAVRAAIPGDFTRQGRVRGIDVWVRSRLP